MGFRSFQIFATVVGLSLVISTAHAENAAEKPYSFQILGEDTSEAEIEAPTFVKPNHPYQPQFVTDDPQAGIVPPDEEPQVRINGEAPGPFKAMAMANQQGDKPLARQYANQFVRYMVNTMFEVRELTQMVGEALVRQGLIKEEGWVGASQFLNREIARVRNDSGTPVKVTHERVLERVTPDLKSEAEIYVFCTLSSTYCRQMGPNIERMWRLVQNDPRLKMGVFFLGDMPQEWLAPFRTYTGMTMPINPGEKIAKVLRVGFVPAVVIRAPNTNQLYLRTGQMDFEKLYQFVRKVQGLPLEPTRDFELVVDAPIGQIERAAATGKSRLWEIQTPTSLRSTNNRSTFAHSSDAEIARF